jgi:hypothetical protein
MFFLSFYPGKGIREILVQEEKTKKALLENRNYNTSLSSIARN